MKICYNTLENIRLTKKGLFRDIIKKKTYHIKKCLYCKKLFLGNKNNLYCSLNCINKKENAIRRNKIPLYNTYKSQLKPYGIKCKRNKLDPNILEVKCYYHNCNKYFIPKLSLVSHKIQVIKGNKKYKGEHNLYCSQECKNKCPVYGKSTEQLIKQDELKSKINNNELVIEYIRDSYIQSQWKQLLIDEYDNKCMLCNNKDNIEAHHIIPAKLEYSCNDIESWDINNGILLCKKCHNKTHKINGCKLQELGLMYNI